MLKRKGNTLKLRKERTQMKTEDCAFDCVRVFKKLIRCLGSSCFLVQIF